MARKPPEPPSPAFQRFVASLVMDFDKWHDGIGYDVGAIAEMTADERGQALKLMQERPTTWRELEVLAALDAQGARKAIEQAAEDPRYPDTRLAAAETLHRQGRMSKKKLEETLVRELKAITTIQGGLTRLLLMAEQHPTEKVKQALLYASWNRTECAPHCAALLCYLQGAAKEPFDWDYRPLFLKLGEHNSSFEREAAFKEVCRMVKMELVDG